jgi:RNA polymerase sigma-70 factor (ECF subfamily)
MGGHETTVRHSEASDEQLMAAYVAGDDAAFAELWRRLAPPLMRLLRWQLNRPEDARDLLQQTFLHLHRSRHDFKPGSEFRPWLWTIALNVKRQHLRQLKRKPEVALEERSDGAGHGASYVEQRELLRTVQGALANLPPDQRDVIVLHWFRGLGFNAVAQEVRASVSAVKVRAHRGYDVLRAAFGVSRSSRSRPPGVRPSRSSRGVR